MGKDKKPDHEKNPRKVLAGKIGGLVKASNQKKGPETSERPAKRQKATPVNDSSNQTDELIDSRPRRRRNMLETPTEKAASPLPKLNLPNTSSRIEYFPHIVIREALPLPITIQTDTGKIYRVTHPLHRFAEHESFRDLSGTLVADVQEAVGTEAFGAAVDCAQKDLHLDLAAHLYPQLLDATRHLRYSKANPSELIVAKKNYKGFLTGVQGNATRLLQPTKEDLQNKRNPLQISEFTKKLLSVEPRALGFIPDHVHKTQMEGYEQTLAHAAELIRQELVGVRTVASN